MKKSEKPSFYHPAFCNINLKEELYKKHGPVYDNLVNSETTITRLRFVMGICIGMAIMTIPFGLIILFKIAKSNLSSLEYDQFAFPAILVLGLCLLFIILAVVTKNVIVTVNGIARHGIKVGEKLGEIITLVAPNQYKLCPNGTLIKDEVKNIALSGSGIEYWILSLIDEYDKYFPKQAEGSLPGKKDLYQTEEATGLAKRIITAYRIYAGLAEPSFGLRSRMEATFDFV